jgi:hypothetical protein
MIQHERTAVQQKDLPQGIDAGAAVGRDASVEDDAFVQRAGMVSRAWPSNRVGVRGVR